MEKENSIQDKTSTNSNPDFSEAGPSGRKNSDPFEVMESLADKTHRIMGMYADRISLAGLQDVRQAPAGLWKFFWTVSLLTCHISFVYLSGIAIVQFIDDSNRLKTEVNIMEKTVDALPFPNITICSPSQMDLQGLVDRLVIPLDVKEYARSRFETWDEFIETFLVYMAYSTREKPQVQDKDYPYFDRIGIDKMKNGRSTFSALAERYYFNCSQVVQLCKLDGIPFDCCEEALKVYTDDAICFTFMTDSKKQLPEKETSEKSGFELEAVVDWRAVPPTYTDMTDGFMVQVGSVFSPFSDAVGAPNGMELIARLTQTKKTAAFKCIPNKANNPPRLQYFSYYDPHGYNCYIEGFENYIALHFVNCLVPYGNFVPNESIACDTQQCRILHDVMYGKYDMYNNEQTTDKWTTTRKRHWLRIRSHLRNIFYNGKCQPMCTTREYSMHIGYSELSPDPTTVHPHYSRSRIKVFFADTKYMESTESPAFNVYVLFYKLGYLASVYAGLSVIGVIELFAYGLVITRYWIVYKMKDRKEKQEKKQSASTGKKGNGNWSTPYRTDTVKSVRILQNQTTL